jgi:CHAT domain
MHAWSGIPLSLEPKRTLSPNLIHPKRTAAGSIRSELTRRAGAETDANIGYLLLEKQQGNADYVSAQLLGEMLQRQRVSLVVLSACQSAALAGESDEPMGSVAARLTATGVPAVLAMTHSVLVTTTRLLFGDFYKHLAKGDGVGEALDNARRFLMRQPEKHEVSRGPRRVRLKLQDWFLPAPYESGKDVLLLKSIAAVSPETSVGLKTRDNLPRPQEAGFFGRQKELWDIERWFSAKTRRISITGFGGQGKTCLAVEAGSKPGVGYCAPACSTASYLLITPRFKESTLLGLLSRRLARSSWRVLPMRTRRQQLPAECGRWLSWTTSKHSSD